jgi:hypothetical protein
MRRLWHDITTHRRATALALVVWLVSLILWLGADEFALLQFPLMIIAGSLAAWWRTTPAPSSSTVDDGSRAGVVAAPVATAEDIMTHGIAAGGAAALLIGAIDTIIFIALVVAYDLANAPNVLVRDVLSTLFIAPIIGASVALLMGAIGGFIGVAITLLQRRWRGRGGPAAPTGVA